MNTKSDVIVSWLFKANELASVDPDTKPLFEEVEYKRIGLVLLVLDCLSVPKLIPPLTNGKSKAEAFKIIVPIFIII
jgi:hypothetical protein